MKGLGLHVEHGATLTPLQHLQSADAAFKRPPADQDDAHAVLLPLRHAIQGTIEELLKARPYPEKASSWVDKVKSVGRHLGRAATPPIQIQMVATTTHTLIDRLSAAKDRVMSREMISALFDESIFCFETLSRLSILPSCAAHRQPDSQSFARCGWPGLGRDDLIGPALGRTVCAGGQHALALLVDAAADTSAMRVLVATSTLVVRAALRRAGRAG